MSVSHAPKELTVRYLPDLKRFDADSLAELGYLRRLFIQSWPTIERYKFRLGAVVSGLSSLKVLSARILEDRLSDQVRAPGALSTVMVVTYEENFPLLFEHLKQPRTTHSNPPAISLPHLPTQILGAFGPKLRELELTGSGLQLLTMDAFEGIESYELLLSIRGTNVTSLPVGFAELFSGREGGREGRQAPA